MSDEVMSALLSLDAASKGYDTAERYYEGRTKEFFASQKLRQLLQGAWDRFRVNYARTPVDVLLERTEISGITSTPDNSVGQYLALVWLENQLGLDAKDVHRMAYEFGDSYLIGQPDDSLDCGVSAYAHDPRNVRVFYDPARPRVKRLGLQRWVELGDEENGLAKGRAFLRVNAYYPDRTELYVSSEPVDDGRGAVTYDVSKLEMREFDDAEDNDTGIVPVFHFRNGRPYGRPEHADAYSVQDMINKVLVSMMVSIDFAGFPQRYILSDSSLNPTDGSAQDWLPSQDQSETTASEQGNFQAGPGMNWLINGAKGVGQFATADSDNFLKPITSLVQQMAAVTDTPMHYFQLTGDAPSGESYRASNAPLDKKTEDRQARFGIPWNEFFAYCMKVRGLRGEATVNWKPPQITTDLSSWQAGNEQIAAGIPREQVWRERGYTEGQIKDFLGQPVDGADSGQASGSGDPVAQGAAGDTPTTDSAAPAQAAPGAPAAAPTSTPGTAAGTAA